MPRSALRTVASQLADECRSSRTAALDRRLTGDGAKTVDEAILSGNCRRTHRTNGRTTFSPEAPARTALTDGFSKLTWPMYETGFSPSGSTREGLDGHRTFHLAP
jgi:hypothetical protein